MTDLEKYKLKLLLEIVADRPSKYMAYFNDGGKEMIDTLNDLILSGSFSWEIYLKRDKHPLWKTRMQNKVKSYLESLKYQKGIRVLHDFHVSSIELMYEVSVKSTCTYPKK